MSFCLLVFNILKLYDKLFLQIVKDELILYHLNLFKSFQVIKKPLYHPTDLSSKSASLIAIAATPQELESQPDDDCTRSQPDDECT